MKKCRVGPETIRMLELGHPWVLADRYTKQWPSGEAGDLIALVDDKNQHLATALYDPKDRIVARILDRKKIQITVEWFEEKLLLAKQLRVHARLQETDAYRWLNSEGDGLPGVTIDRYGDYLMLQLYTSAWDVHLDRLTTAVRNVFQPMGVYRKLRPQETRALEAKRRSKEYSRVIAGTAAPVPLQVTENGLNYLVDLREGLNTGLFPDQRRNRQEFSERVAGKRVLNLFAFTGAFSVAAAAAGAQKVTSVDVSAKYLDIARENFSINRINPKRHEFVVNDVFTELAKMQGQQRCFDIILFDPPSFSTTSKSRFSTHGGTSKLVLACLPLLESGGLLVSSSNHQKVSMEDYLKELRRGALQSGDDLRTIFIGGQPEDFPCSVSFPEGRYLKFVISVKS
ncbi:SAM-dependent methyltransferase [Desulfuromusa kysingii]|uniref:SAM-dependent methyltransferase n=1 Tax=Desulfuromusa kysingii TaxID=37625 RepID=A0A1H3Y5U3_9BACT|nr:class I SAM-dependent rRNA methyltransferase [Desulfuromusa kysingii]SEA06214.1 SAM-dependent methyltransferase [Desulfuromusa kysingii]